MARGHKQHQTLSMRPITAYSNSLICEELRNKNLYQYNKSPNKQHQYQVTNQVQGRKKE